MPTSTKDVQIYDLTHDWGHGMPQWPSRANLNVRVVEFHAKDGLLAVSYTHLTLPTNREV